MALVIDAHQHVWARGRAEYGWLSPGPLDADFDLDAALPAMRRAGVDATVLVQAADNAEDTENMLAVADRNPEVVGIVVWVSLDDPDATEARLTRLRSDPRVVGVRNLIHDRADPAWILRSDVDEGLGVLDAAGVPLDYVTADPAALAHLPLIAGRHPNLRIVVDHLGKPPIGADESARASWRGLLAAAAGIPRVSAKISGLYPAVGPIDKWSPELLRPFVDDALELFGTARLMFGSDWPVSLLAGGYDRVWHGLETLFAELDPVGRDAVLGGTAADFYRIDLGLLARVGKDMR